MQQQEHDHSAQSGPATTLDEMLESGCSASEAWKYFLEHFPSRDCPALLKPSLSDLPKLKWNYVFGKLLQQVLTETLYQGRTSSIPSVEEVCSKLDEIGVMTPKFHVDVILRTLLAHIRTNTIPNDATKENEASKSNIAFKTDDDLLQFVMPFWKILFKRHFRARQDTSKLPVDYGWSAEWPTIPTGFELHSMIARNSYNSSKTLVGRIGLYFYGLPAISRDDFAMAVLLTLDKLLQQNLTNSDFQPFVHVTSYLLFKADLGNTISAARTKLLRDGNAEDETQRLLERLKNLPLQGLVHIRSINKDSVSVKSETANDSESMNAKESEPLEYHYHHLLARARETQDYRRVEHVWDEVQHLYADVGDVQSFQIPTHLYDGLIMSAMALKRPTEAI